MPPPAREGMTDNPHPGMSTSRDTGPGAAHDTPTHLEQETPPTESDLPAANQRAPTGDAVKDLRPLAWAP